MEQTRELLFTTLVNEQNFQPNVDCPSHWFWLHRSNHSLMAKPFIYRQFLGCSRCCCWFLLKKKTEWKKWTETVRAWKKDDMETSTYGRTLILCAHLPTGNGAASRPPHHHQPASSRPRSWDAGSGHCWPEYGCSLAGRLPRLVHALSWRSWGTCCRSLRVTWASGSASAPGMWHSSGKRSGRVGRSRIASLKF